jgi:hypothetical protein
VNAKPTEPKINVCTDGNKTITAIKRHAIAGKKKNLADLAPLLQCALPFICPPKKTLI